MAEVPVGDASERHRPPMPRFCLTCLHRMRHACALARGAARGPHDFASAVLRVDQYHCLGRPSLRRLSSLGGEVAPNGICRVGAGCGRKRAPEKIDAPAGVTQRITWVSAELRGAEVPRSAPPSWEGPVVILGIEGPDVEVLDAVLLVHESKAAPWQSARPRRRPAYRRSRADSARKLGLGVSGQRGESKQVSYVDPRQRSNRIRRHAATLSQQLPEPSDAATSGVRHVRAPLQPVIWRPKTMQKGWPTGSVKTRKPVSRSSGIRMAPRTSISCTLPSTCRSPCSGATRPSMHAARRPLISAVIVWQRSATERDLEVRGRTRGGLAAVPAASSVALVVAYYEFAPMSCPDRWPPSARAACRWR